MAPHADKPAAGFQWAQLFALSGVHFVVDMLAAILPPILPTIRQEFSLSLSVAGSVIVVLMLTANGVQILSGSTRANKRKPTLLSLGLLLIVSVCFIAPLSELNLGLTGLIVLALISGCGIAVTHPESLRAVHALDAIPSAVSTSIFMTGGYLGFAGAGAVSTLLVSNYGLSGLYLLALLPVLGVVLLYLLRIRMAVESDQPARKAPRPGEKVLPFWLVLLMALPAATSITVLVALLPTMLSEFGFELTFGGYSSTLYALGAAAGAYVWGSLGHKKGELRCCIAAFLMTIPFLVVYFLLARHRWAVWLLFGAGFCSIPAYVLIITLARSAAGLSLGLRMGLVIGGTWGVANLAFMGLAVVADRVGTAPVIKTTVLGFPLSAAFGLYLLLKYKPKPLRTAHNPILQD